MRSEVAGVHTPAGLRRYRHFYLLPAVAVASPSASLTSSKVAKQATKRLIHGDFLFASTSCVSVTLLTGLLGKIFALGTSLAPAPERRLADRPSAVNLSSK